jgi:hypothetical protein
LQKQYKVNNNITATEIRVISDDGKQIGVLPRAEAIDYAVGQGFEQNGKNENFERPILVFRKFGKDMLWAIPLTSKIKEGIFYFDIRHLGFKSSLILSQLKLLSSKRLIRKIGIIPANDFANIKDAVIKLVK